jgi:hypothetical protein
MNRSLILKVVASTRAIRTSSFLSSLVLPFAVALSGTGCAAEAVDDPTPPAQETHATQAATEPPATPEVTPTRLAPVESIDHGVGLHKHPPQTPLHTLGDNDPDPQPSPWRGPPPPHGQVPCDPAPYLPGSLTVRDPHHHPRP